MANNIKPTVSKQAAYIFHMLSCAKCGYDNAYGNQFASLHKESSLKDLKEYELLITVKGGEHSGRLYWPVVCVPAAMEMPLDDYYQTLISVFGSKDFNGDGIKYFSGFGFDHLSEVYRFGEELAKELALISQVMMENYQIYSDSLWSDTEPKLLAYAENIKAAFDENNISLTLEQNMGITPKTEFHPVFCNSLEGGPQAIDVSTHQHIFNTDENIEGMVRFITHEYAIFLLKHVLVDFVELGELMKYWLHIESLAAFYYGEIFPGRHVFLKNRKIIEYYEAASKNGMSPREMFLSAIKSEEFKA